MKSLKANEILTTRDNLSKSISNNWAVIYAENKMPKGRTRQYDLKILFNQILKMSEERINYKLYSQAINMGYKSMSDFPKDSIYEKIYRLSEYQERLVKLSKLPVVTNPRSKYTDIYKKVTVDSMVSELSVAIAKIRLELQNYNDRASLIIG